MTAPQPESHFTYEALHARLKRVLRDEEYAKQVLRIVRYALEMEALTALRDDSQIAREILLLADALADEPGSPQLAAAYDALAGDES